MDAASMGSRRLYPRLSLSWRMHFTVQQYCLGFIYVVQFFIITVVFFLI